MTVTADLASSADLNLRVLHPLACFVRDRHGDAALARVAAAGGVAPSDLDGASRWVSHAQFEALLATAREMMPDDEAFRAACAYRLPESFGSFRWLLWATSMRAVFHRAATNMRIISAISRYDLVAEEGHTSVWRYHSERSESRLMCLSRLGQIEAIPTLWGFPRAQVTEGACIAAGDPYCEYTLRLYAQRRWLPVLLGVACGAAAAVPVAQLAAHDATHLLLPALGGALAHIYELHRTQRANLGVVEQINDGLRELAQQDAQARQELLALHQRQREWARVLEEQVAARTSRLQLVVERIEELQQARIVQLRGVSHDLRNPLTVIGVTAAYLRRVLPDRSRDVEASLEDLDRAIDQMQRLLTELMQVGSPGDDRLFALACEPIEVGPLTERLRRQMRALVHGRDIRVSVFATREAPGSVRCDPLLLDRIVDNLFTNAAKYTERGSIVVEVGGKPGFLTVKVSDTGRGIDEAQIERIFLPRAAGDRRWDSYGLGLSVVVRLLEQIGGQLEVMSKPAVGTTFWVHVPVEPRPAPPPRAEPAAMREDGGAVGRVVRIRRVVSE